MRPYSLTEIKEVAEIYGDVISWAWLNCYEPSDVPAICAVVAEAQKIPEELRTPRFSTALGRLEALVEALAEVKSRDV